MDAVRGQKHPRKHQGVDFLEKVFSKSVQQPKKNLQSNLSYLYGLADWLVIVMLVPKLTPCHS